MREVISHSYIVSFLELYNFVNYCKYDLLIFLCVCEGEV